MLLGDGEGMSLEYPQFGKNRTARARIIAALSMPLRGVYVQS